MAVNQASTGDADYPKASPTRHQGTESSIVIIGAGIIGCATAYYLSQSQSIDSSDVHIVESSPELFASASGKSGGFLAPDWFSPAAASLGELSFALHKQLADEHDGFKNWGYSQSTGSSMVTSSTSDTSADGWLSNGNSRAEAAGIHEFKDDKSSPGWLTRRRGDQVELLTEDGGVAQVDPLRLSQNLLRLSTLDGVHLHQPATVTEVSHDASGVLSGVHLRPADGTSHHIQCSRILIAAGAWTPRVFSHLFPSSTTRISITSLAGHSLVVKSPRWSQSHESAGCHAVFTTTRTGFSPEIFSRIGEEIYIAGLNDSTLPLPDQPTDAKIDASSIGKLKSVAQQYLGLNNTDASDLEVLREGLCFRPVTERGAPILTRIKDERLGEVKTRGPPTGGVFIAAGHGPWGISHSLGTGKVMAEMMLCEPLSANVKGLGM